jgi:hypothetical protein
MNQLRAPEGRLATGTELSHTVPRLRRLAWLPVPVYIALIAILYITLPRELAASLVDPPD